MRFTPQSIVPTEFEYLDSYDLGNAEDKPLNTGACSRLLEEQPVENFEAMSKCCVCGTTFRHGDVWLHKPSGVRIVIGHRCAERYGLMASRGEYRNMRASIIKKREYAAERRRVRAEMKKFLREHTGPLVDHLRFDHPTVRRIRAVFIRWGSLSGPQLRLVEKIICETKAHRKAEVGLGPSIPVVEGRHEMTGTILALKYKNTNPWPGGNSTVLKMLVRVDGWYKVWGTCPDALADALWELVQKDESFEGGTLDWVRQHPVRVRFTATVMESDDDTSFGWFKRPVKAEVLS